MVELFSWNPRLPLLPGKTGRSLMPAMSRQANNFGDMLGPALTSRLLAEFGIVNRASDSTARLLTIGSVLHFARDGDIVWGSGRNGKIAVHHHRFSALDVRAVRGPLTADFLQTLGVEAPRVFGDPGLLTARMFPELLSSSGKDKHALTISPNFNDFGALRDRRNVLNPRGPLINCLARIANSDLVVGSSLHGIIVAESYGVPARLVRPHHESDFKYRDYYLGTGREVPETAPDVATAIRMGGAPPLEYDSAPLIETFPYDLWNGTYDHQ